MIKYLFLFLASIRLMWGYGGAFTTTAPVYSLESYTGAWSVDSLQKWNEVLGGWEYVATCNSETITGGSTWANHFIAIGGQNFGVNRIGVAPIPNSGLVILPPDTDITVNSYYSNVGGGLIANLISGASFRTPPRPKQDPALTRKVDLLCKTGTCPANGMAIANANAMLCSLNLTDTPLSYSPPIGGTIDFTLTYNQKESSQNGDTINYSNVGPKWTHNWLGYVDETTVTMQVGLPKAPSITADDSQNPPHLSFAGHEKTPALLALIPKIILPGGGVDAYPRSGIFLEDASLDLPYVFSNPNSDDTRTTPNDKHIELVKTNTGYERHAPDGSKMIFGLKTPIPGIEESKGSRYFLTQIIDPVGNAIVLAYNETLPLGTWRLNSITDPLGQITSFFYEDSGDPLKITKVTDPFGRSCLLEYSNHLLSKITDVISLASQFTYMGDFVTALTTPYGTSTFAYGETGAVNGSGAPDQWLTLTDPQGGVERVEYHDQMPTLPAPGSVPSAISGWSDAQLRYTLYWGKKAMLDNPGDPKSAHLYHWAKGVDAGVSGALMDEKSALENRVFYLYEGQLDPDPVPVIKSRRPIVVARVLDDGSSQVFRSAYDSHGNLVQSTDPLGRQSSFIYDANGIDLLETDRQTGPGTHDVLAKVTYNSQHLPLTYTDASGQVTTLTYNAAGQLRSAVNAKGETTTLWYHPTGRPAVGEALDASAIGYLVLVTGAVSGSTMRFTYDTNGRARTSTDPEGYTVTTDYDAFDRPTQTTFPDGTSEQLTYDKLDLVASRDRRGRVTKMAYNPVGQVIAITDPLLRVTQYNWCTCGMMVGLTDPAGQQTRWQYDVQGRLSKKIYADGSQLNYAYEATTSRLLSMTDAKGQKKNYSYFLDNSLQQLSYTSAVIATPSVSFTYDANYARVVTMTDGTGTTAYAYNNVPITPTLGAGKLASVDGPLANDTISYTYDELGRSLSRSINGTANVSSTVYDALGRVTSATNVLGTFGYSYVNTTGRVDHVDYPNGQRTNYSYYPDIATSGGNGDRRLQQIQNLKSVGGLNLSTFGYTYDLEGMILSWSKQFDATAALPGSFKYDAADQLIEAEVGMAPSVSKNYIYRYDRAGNRTSEQTDNAVFAAVHNNVNQLTATAPSGPIRVEGTLNKPSTVKVNGVSASVDAGNKFSADVPLAPGTSTISVVATDGNGNASTKNYQMSVASGASRALTYDANGNLLDDGAGKTYAWDAADRLTKITEGANVTEFIYDGLGRRVQEKLNGAVIKQWVWCGAAQPCEERNASNVVTKRFYEGGEQVGGIGYFFTYDHLGSVREMSDATGTIHARYDYSPYGESMRTVGDMEADFGFTGFYRHQGSSLLLSFFRAYDTDLGRWISRDPIEEDGGVNLHRYCENNPINLWDDTGASPNGGAGRQWIRDHVKDSAQQAAQLKAFNKIWDEGKSYNYLGPTTLIGSLAAIETVSYMTKDVRIDGPTLKPNKLHGGVLTGKICQFRYKDTPFFRLDYTDLPTYKDTPVLHMHIWPIMQVHIPLQVYGKGAGTTPTSP